MRRVGSGGGGGGGGAATVTVEMDAGGAVMGSDGRSKS